MLIDDVVDRLAVDHRSRAGRVVGHHPANGRAARGRDVGRKAQAVRLERSVELVEDDAGLDARPSLRGIHLEQAIEILRGVDDDAAADGLSGLRGAAAAHRDRSAVLAAEADGADDVVAGFGEDDGEGRDLVDAGVGGVERAGDRVGADFALQLSFEGGAEWRGIDARCGHERGDCSLGAPSRLRPGRDRGSGIGDRGSGSGIRDRGIGIRAVSGLGQGGGRRVKGR